MSVESGFDELQATVNASKDAVDRARERRDTFKSALPKDLDVFEVVPTGSLARGTHCDPIHDVDLVCVFDAELHPEWGKPGRSAHDALEHARARIRERLGSDGTDGNEVRLCLLRTHSVKSFLDDPNDPDAFTVDVVPALRHSERGFLIPECPDHNDPAAGEWVHSDPLELVRLTAERHRAWNRFAGLVRVLKRWNRDHGNHMKSLTVEVLALELLVETERPTSIARFFAAAAQRVWSPITDPANLCGEIQPGLDKLAASEALSSAAELAAAAVDAAAAGQSAKAMCLWREVFGAIFPAPHGGCSGSGLAVVSALAGIAAVPRRKIVDAPQG